MPYIAGQTVNVPGVGDIAPTGFYVPGVGSPPSSGIPYTTVVTVPPQTASSYPGLADSGQRTATGGIIPVAVAASVLSVGSKIDDIVNVARGFFDRFKGTAHASYEQVRPVADSFAPAIVKAMVDAYGADAPSKISPYVAALFGSAMSDWWGLGASLNQSINTDLAAHKDDMLRVSWLYVIWVYTNVDQDAGTDENSRIFYGLFTRIFLAGIAQAGYNQLLFLGVPTQNISIPGGGKASGGTVQIGGSSPVGGTGVQPFNFAGVGLVAGVLILIIILFNR